MTDDRSRPSKKLSRRGLLRTSGGALGLGAMLGVSGCLSALPPLGDQQTYGRLDAPVPEEPTYAQWVPAPSETNDQTLEKEYYLFGADTPGTTTRIPRLLALRRASTICSLDYFGVDWANYDRYIWTPFGSVLSGDFSANTVRTTLSETSYAQNGTYRVYDFFERADGRLIGVSDGTLLFGTPAHERADLTRLADTGAGDHPRLRDADSAGAAVVNAAGSGLRLGGAREFGSFHEQAQWGVETFRVGADGFYQVITLIFPSASSVTLSDVKTAYREQTGLRAGWTAGVDSFDAGRDDRIVTLEARIPQRNLVNFQEFAAPVQATWGFDWNATSRRLTIRHEAGEPVPAARLSVDIDTDEAPYRRDSREIWAGAGTVTPGDRTTLDLSETRGLQSVSLNVQRAHDKSYWSLAHWDIETATGSDETA